MEFQTPIRKDSNIVLSIQQKAQNLRESLAVCEPDEENTLCIIELNECEKILNLIEEHRERYESQQELDEQLQKQAYAFRFGSPIE